VIMAHIRLVEGNHNSNGNGNGHSILKESWPDVPQPFLAQEEEEIDLRQLFQTIKRRWLTIAIIGCGALAGVWFWTDQQEPIYESKFHLLIEPPTEQQATPLPLPGVVGGSVDYATQIEVLLSPTVLEPIIENMKPKYPKLDYPSMALGKKAPLKIQQLKDTKILEISYQDPDRKKTQFVLEHLAKAYLQYSQDERQTELNKGNNFAKQQSILVEDEVDKLQEKLQQFRLQHNLLNPETHAAQLSQQLVTLEEQYVATEVKLSETRSLYDILEGEIGLAPEEALASSYLSESPRYQNLLNQLQEVEIKLAKESARFFHNSPVIQDLKEEQQNLLPLLREEETIALGNNLVPTNIDSSSLANPSSLRLELNSQLIQTANQLKVLQIRRLALEQELGILKQKIRQMPSIAREYTDLQRELKIATENLIRLLTAEQNLELEVAQQALPWKVISPAQLPENPIYPKVPLNLALGTFAGFLLGIGAALLRDRLDPAFHSVEELKDSTRLPLLASVSFDKQQKKKYTNQGKGKKEALPSLKIVSGKADFDKSLEFFKMPKRYAYSEFEEAFRSLHTNIRLLGSDSVSKSLLISSSVPGEGKSTVSVNLAKAASEMGHRVLLIDADMRLPQVHQRLNLLNTVGLSNLLSNDGLDLEELVQTPTEAGLETLSVLTAGEIPPSPMRLLSSQRMERLREQLDRDDRYDLIIYDTPPVLFADAKILGVSTRGIILVATMDKTNRYELKEAIEELKMSRVPILGLVANKVKLKSKGSYYNKYNRYRYHDNGHNNNGNQYLSRKQSD